MGGHVIFSHYAFFDGLVNAGVGGDGPTHWNSLQRVSYVWVKGSWVAYPFQNNLAALPVPERAACLAGLADAACAAAARPATAPPPANFEEWILRAFGPGIADVFMRPYNFKVWAVPPSLMQCGWLGERVATVDVRKAVANTIGGVEDAGWGPNAVFRFPTRGGTGAIWRGVADRCVPASRQRYGPGMRVTALDLESRTATLACGAVVRYGALLTTAPLDLTLAMVGRPDLADGLSYSSTHIIGVGLRGPCPHPSKCWLYFPEDDCPFYRATVFSNYAAANVPGAEAALRTLCRGDGGAWVEGEGGGEASSSSSSSTGPYWSLMFEVSESASHKPVDSSPAPLGGTHWPAVVADTLRGAVATGLISADSAVVSLYHRRLERGYPTPSLTRDGALEKALPFLKEKNVWSRGRFGSWKYEVGNQDHSVALGAEAVDNILFGAPELTLTQPDLVNRARNEGMVWGEAVGAAKFKKGEA
jgi:protoporphyrinogen oxidase